MYEKLKRLKADIESLGSLAVAFSGGVDSTFLLKVAHDTIGENAVAITAQSCSFPERELKETVSFCSREGIRQILCRSGEMEIEDYRRNPINRCYYCKNELFTLLKKIAEENGISNVAEGSNTDDTGDYRPGLQAAAELGIKSPLRKAGLSKQEIRALSKELGLPTWNKPAFACLASRIPYGEEISAEKLKMVEKAEQLLMDSGFGQFRVRVHGNVARIEILPDEFDKLLRIRENIAEKFKEYGFAYVSMDLLGYRMGSMNETIKRS